MNRKIAKEKFTRKINKFQKEGLSTKEKWKIASEETGQKKYSSTIMIKKGKLIHTKHREMAGALNRQYIQRIRKFISEMESSGENRINPLINY